MTDNSPATDKEIEHIESVADSGGYTPTTEFRIRSLIARIRAETAKNSGEAYVTTNEKGQVETHNFPVSLVARGDPNRPFLTEMLNYYNEQQAAAKNSGEALTVAVRKLGLEELVHGWHASGAYDKHPDELGVKLPSNCGTVYAIAAALSDLPDATPANSRAEAIGVDVRNYGARGSIFDADPIRKAAWKVVLETDRIHDNEPWPIKYRAPYEAIAELRALLQQEGE